VRFRCGSATVTGKTIHIKPLSITTGRRGLVADPILFRVDIPGARRPAGEHLSDCSPPRDWPHGDIPSVLVRKSKSLVDP
jgi:hypothetical protein